MSVTDSPAETGPEPTPTEELWQKFQETQDPEIKGELVARYQQVVRYVAERMASNLPRSVDVDDLIQEGTFGLMDAIDKFDLDRGIKFKTYCSTRIRGAILDSLRGQDWAPRLARSRGKQAEKIRLRWIADKGREPSNNELAKEMELSLSQASRARNTHAMLNLSDRRMPTGGEDAPLGIEGLGKAAGDSPLDAINRKDLMEVITESLNEKERSILHYYYIEGLTLREIGEAMHLTESRVCQIHGNVIKRLREKLQGSADQFGI